MKLVDYSDIEDTVPASEIPTKVSRVQNGFNSGKTRSLELRQDLLRNLYYALRDNRDFLNDALYKDLNRPAQESSIIEIGSVLDEIRHIVENLADWAKPVKREPVPSFHAKACYVTPVPLGTVLVIGPWNFPYLTTIGPIANAIAAGNTVILKPSELSPHSSKAVVKLLTSVLPPDIFQYVTGDAQAVTELLKIGYGKIIYTGNGRVGSIVAAAAAKTLTPTLLELGGKSPSIITNNASVYSAARRILWGKTSNAGQVCVTTDYILIERGIKNEFLNALVKVYHEMFPSPVTKDSDYCHIISDNHFKRLDTLLKNTKGRIIIGGVSDEKSKFIAPTVVDDVKHGDALLEDEIFGPILPIVTVENVEEALSYIRTHHDNPLATYIFSKSSKEKEYIFNNTKSGAVVFNDTVIHPGFYDLPFGGVGQSGYGYYHGKYGFDSFSHLRAAVDMPYYKYEPTQYFRSPPYYPYKLKIVELFSTHANFSRTGPIGRSFARSLAIRIFWLLIVIFGLTTRRALPIRLIILRFLAKLYQLLL